MPEFNVSVKAVDGETLSAVPEWRVSDTSVACISQIADDGLSAIVSTVGEGTAELIVICGALPPAIADIRVSEAGEAQIDMRASSALMIEFLNRVAT